MDRADALVLDIGGEVGAVLVYTDESLAGKELDLVPAGSPRSHDLHNVVRRRTTANGEALFAAVFPEVPQGRYTLWGLADQVLAEVVVAGGCVTKVATASPQAAP
jgi:hypothetical protein